MRVTTFGIAALHQASEFLVVEQPVEIDPGLRRAVGSGQERSIAGLIESGIPAVEAAADREDRLQPMASGRVQEIGSSRLAFDARGFLPERERLVLGP